MSIEIQTSTAFDKRLAELAWNDAGESVKTTVINTLALAIASDRTLMDRLSSKIFTKLVDDCISAIKQSEPVARAVAKATKAITDKIAEAQAPLADELSKPLIKSVEHMRPTIVENALKQATENTLFHFRATIGKNRNIRGMAMRAIFNGVIEATKQRAMDSSASIDNEFRAAIIKALDAMKKREPDELLTLTDFKIMD